MTEAKRLQAIRAVQRLDERYEGQYQRWRGWIKSVDGSTHVAGRSGYVYVQRRDVGVSVQLEEVRLPYGNVPDIDGYPIIVGRDSLHRDSDVILGRDVDIYNEWLYDYLLQKHADQHIAPGGFDIVWINGRAVLPLRVSPQLSADLSIKVEPGVYPSYVGNEYFDGATSVSLSGHVPANGQRWVVVGINQRTGVIELVPGDIVFAGNPLTAADLPEFPNHLVVLAAVQLYVGQTEIVEENIWDLRSFCAWARLPDVYDDGILIVEGANVLSFTGEGVSISAGGNGTAIITITGGNGGGTTTADQVTMDFLAGATYRTVQDWADVTQSAGRISGGAITDAAPLINVAAGIGFIKSVDAHIGDVKFFDWPAVNGLAPGDLRKSWVYVDYNAGVPTVTVTDTQTDINRHTRFYIAELWRDGNTLHILEEGQNVYDTGSRAHRSLEAMFGFRRGSGLAISESGADRTVAMSQGFMYRGLNEIPQAAIDTDPGGAADTFITCYRDGIGGWTETPGQSVISNTQYDDGDGGLANLLPNHYGVFWVYLDFDNHLHIQYGQGNYTIAQAEAAPVPATDPFATEFAMLIARIIVEQGVANFYSVSFPWDDCDFTFAAVADHGNLAGLSDHDHTMYPPLRYVSVLSGGVITEYADPDDAFTAAVAAGDVILVPPGTWTLDAAHTLAVGVSVYGLGPNSECTLNCTTALGTLITVPNDATSGIYNCKITYTATDNGAALTALRVNGDGHCKRCIAQVVNLGTGGAVAIHVVGATIYDSIAHAEGAGGVVNGHYFDGGALVRATSIAQLTAAGTRACGVESVSAIGYVFHTAGRGYGAFAPRYGWYSSGGTLNLRGILGRWDGADADIYVDSGTLVVYAMYYATVGGAGTITHGVGDRAGKARDEAITGIWTFNEELILKEQGADPVGVAGYGKVYTKDDAGETKLYFQNDAGEVFEIAEVVTDVTKTVGGAGDFATIQTAIDWFKGRVIAGDCVIQELDAVQYSVAGTVADFSSLLVQPGATLTLLGDTRALAGITYIDGSIANPAGIANGGTFAAGNRCTLTVNAAGDRITVAGGTVAPNFIASWGGGDKILVWGNDSIVYPRVISFIAGTNTFVITVALPAGAFPGGGGALNDGCAVALVPDRELNSTGGQSVVDVPGPSGIVLDGWYVTTNVIAGWGINVSNAGQVALASVLVWTTNTGGGGEIAIRCSGAGSLVEASTGNNSTWNDASGWLSTNGAAIGAWYAVAVAHQWWAVGFNVASNALINCSHAKVSVNNLGGNAFQASRFCSIACDESGVRGNGVGTAFAAYNAGFIYAVNTVANCNVGAIANPAGVACTLGNCNASVNYT